MKIVICSGILLALGLGCCPYSEPHVADVYPYNRPLSSPGTKFGGMPPAVQHTVRAQTGTAEIHDIAKTVTPEVVVYEIFYVHRQLFPPLYVAADGSVLFPDLITVAVPAGHSDFGPISGGPVSGVKFSDLPIKVANAIQEMVPTAEVAYISKTVSGDAVLYEVTFKEPNHPQMVFSENGRLIETRAAPRRRDL